MSTYKYIDVHAHLNFPQYDKDREEVIDKCKEQGIIIVNVGIDLNSSGEAVALAEKYGNCYAIIGMHPTTANREDFDLEAFSEMARHPKVVAIGECGLDFYHEPFMRDKQEKVFKQQIDLALKYNKPIMIHARNSYKEILSILDQYLTSSDVKLRGNVHFFAGTVEEANEFIKRGFTLSFTGVITFAKEYEKLLALVSEKSVLSETDCPFVTPVPHRGERNSPLNIPIIVSKMAQIKDISEDSMASLIRQSSTDQFGISFV